MKAFNIGAWLIQIGWFWGNWTVEWVPIEYEGEPKHYHRALYLGPLVLSWETIKP